MTTGNLKWLSLLFVICVFCHFNAEGLRGTRDLALAMNIIDQAYVEPTDEKKLYEAAITGMLKSLDTNTSYIGQDQLSSFESIFEQEFGGLGVGLDGPPRRSALTVASTIFNSPAFRAGIRPGDVIAKIDGHEVRGSRVEDVSLKLRGREGTSVTLVIDRDGQEMEKSLVRERIEVESVLGDRRQSNGAWNYLLEADSRIAYVRIELFGEKTTEEFRKAIESCREEPRGIVIDLRDNSGGLLLSAAQICDMFLDEGMIVTTKGRGGRIDEVVKAASGTLVPETCPIAILINENSASASEILAGCLKDRQRASIIGTRSFGKGSVQNVIPIEGGKAAIRLTTAYYYPPSGRRIHRRNSTTESDWGVDPTPGCAVGMTQEELETAVDRFRQRSLPVESSPVEPKPDPSSAEVRSADPSLAADPQLAFAVKYVQKQLAAK